MRQNCACANKNRRSTISTRRVNDVNPGRKVDTIMKLFIENLFQSKRNLIILFIGSGIILLSILIFSSQRSILLFETFDDPDTSESYLTRQDFSLENGRLRVKIDTPTTGCSIFIPGTYNDFSLETLVYSVGNLADASSNIIFRQTQFGWYEVWLRLDTNQVQLLKLSQDNQGVINDMQSLSNGWVDFLPGITHSTVNHLGLDVQGNEFQLWLNNHNIVKVTDSIEPIFLEGEIQIGAGTGEVGGVTIEFDDLKILER